jgi:nicotinamidase/pyrazinamidase
MVNNPKKALVLVDLQNDFLPGGSLAVERGDEVIPVANAVQRGFDLIVATQDWHPANHGSFASNHEGKKPGDVIELHGLQQVLWPDHCVQGTRGAEFHRDVDLGRVQRVFRKATDSEIDSYSAFFDNGHLKSTGLGDFLKAQGVEEIYIAGLATDYCVKFTAFDALDLGFRTYLIEDGVRGVNLSPNDSAEAIEAMRAAGVVITTSAAIR